MDQVLGAVEYLQNLNKFTTKTLSPRLRQILIEIFISITLIIKLVH